MFLNARWRHLAVYNKRDTLELILKEQRNFNYLNYVTLGNEAYGPKMWLLFE